LGVLLERMEMTSQTELERLMKLKVDEVLTDAKWREEHLAYHYMFWVLLYKDGQNGTEVTGLSLRQSGMHWNLTLKAVVDGIPSVAFVTEQTPTACVRAVCRLWLLGKMKWYPDKYA